MPEINETTEIQSTTADVRPSSKNFSGNVIPYHNAKIIKETLENGSSPLLPKDGVLAPESIYNARTGYILPAQTLIPAQIMKAERGFESNVVSDAWNMKAAGTQKKQLEKGIMYNFLKEDKEGQGKSQISTSTLYFADQSEHPDKVAAYAAEHYLKDKKKLEGISIEVKSADDYLTAYLAAAKSGVTVKVSPEVTDAFKQKMIEICDHQFKHDRFKEKGSPLHDYLFDCDKKSVDMVKEIAKANNIDLSPKQKEQENKVEQKKPEKKDRRVNREEMSMVF